MRTHTCRRAHTCTHGTHIFAPHAHTRRFREDLQLTKELGCTSFRFSFEWARVEPVRGQYDQAAIKRWVCCALPGLERSGAGVTGAHEH